MDFLTDPSRIKVLTFVRDTFMPPLACRTIEITGPENEFMVCKDAIALRYKFPENIYQQDDLKTLTKYKDYIVEWDICEFSAKNEIWLLKKGVLGIFDAHPYIASFYEKILPIFRERIAKETETLDIESDPPGIWWSQFKEGEAPDMQWRVSMENGMGREQGPGIDANGQQMDTYE